MEDETVRAKKLSHAIDEAIEHYRAEHGWERVPAIAHIAGVVSVSPRTVSRWAAGEAVPDLLQVVPLANELGVSPMLFVQPPEVPAYPLDEYLVRQATAEGLEEGIRRASRPRRRRGADAESAA